MSISSANETGATMNMNFGPKDEREAALFAQENLRVDVQHRLQTVMNHLGVSQSELASRLGTSEAWVSQLFGSRMNMTVRTMARVFHALGDECVVTSKVLEKLWAGRRDIGTSCEWTQAHRASEESDVHLPSGWAKGAPTPYRCASPFDSPGLASAA
jgi:transcriptional regulator with XRE-family HTH domain